MSLEQLEAKTKWVAAEVFSQFGLVFDEENANVSFTKSFMKDTCTLLVFGSIFPIRAEEIMDVLEEKFFKAFTDITMERHGNESISITVRA